MGNSKKKLSLGQKQSLAGWAFLTPAVILIAIMSFLPMIQALFLSFQSGIGAAMKWTGGTNYVRMFKDPVFMQALKNNFIYLIIQVPIMLMSALILASLLNNKDLRFKGAFPYRDISALAPPPWYPTR